LIEAFVDHAAEAVAFLEDRTPLRFTASRTYSDYFADRPTGKSAGRSLDAVPYASRDALGSWDAKIRDSPQLPRLTMDEMAGGTAAADPKNGKAVAFGATELAMTLVDRIADRERTGVRAGGGSLVGALLRGALDREVAVTLGARARHLVLDDGVVVGAVVQNAETELRIGARCGVVIATGGFEWNTQLVRAFLGVPQVWPLSPPTNVGDGLMMALEAGAALANMSVSWAIPVTSDGESTYEGFPQHLMATPRQEPGCIAVNRLGRRFVNEAISYMDLPKMLRVYDPLTQSYPNDSPAWMLFDQSVRDRTVSGDMQPGGPTPQWVKEAPSIRELAALIDVNADTLEEEVTRWNRNVEDRSDPDFGRGTVWFEGWARGGPNADTMLAPIDRPPYYAIPLLDGILGTAGGLLINADAQVRHMRGGVIEGLYAAGNAAASIFGPSYPAGGATLGPALTFGYLAGRHLRAIEPRQLAAPRDPAGTSR
jgi:succinate dehydrogenase/fumarate reductase flavoprotein subunit